jgi:benzoyl-CoA reductase/2-hydroxyglutaryl-CoA dehydratase subunit BcrC/BadD/HgdB
VPVEGILAAGLSPQRLIPQGRNAGANGHLHPNTCQYVKSLLADALDGSFSGVDAVVLVNSCDAMRRLFDVWGRYVQGPTPLFLDIPRQKSREDIELFSSGLRRLAADLSRLEGASKVTGEGLVAAVRKVNALRSAFTRLFHALGDPGSPVRGSDIFSLLQEPAMLDDPAFQDRVVRLLQNPCVSPSSGRRRIFLAGNVMNSRELIAMIEAAGAHIAGIDTCFGMSHYAQEVAEDAPDPFLAVARRYLLRPACPRMMGIQEQIDSLCSSAREAGSDGVVLCTVKFCNGMAYNLPLVRQACTAAGMASLVLENDYEWSDMEKARIKVETFLDMSTGAR